MRGTKKIAVVAALAAAGLCATSAQAAVVQINAEDGTLGAGWETTPLAGAIGGQAIQGTVDDTGGEPSSDAARAVYSVNLPEAGEYDLYVRFALSPDDNIDSIFVANNFGTPGVGTGTGGEWSTQNSLSVTDPPKAKLADIPVIDGGTASNYPADVPIWVNFSAAFEDVTVPGQSTDSDEAVPTFLAAAAGLHEYQLAHREAMFKVDAIAFALTSERGTLSVDSGGNLVIPEPGSLALLGLGGLALLGLGGLALLGRKRRTV